MTALTRRGCWLLWLVCVGVVCVRIGAALPASVARDPSQCRKLHSACVKCKNTRITEQGKVRPRTVLLCTWCAPGWRIRAGDPRFCDCAPGFFPNGTQCTPCTQGRYCPGKPVNSIFDCPPGLATLLPGAKSASQCMTWPGWGRSFVRGSNATVSVKGTKCPLGYYNSGGNSMGCQACPQGLTSRQEASTSLRDCVAPPGWYIRGEAGSKCPRGTYTTDFNSAGFCDPCDQGLSTAAEGSTGVEECKLAARGHYLQLQNSAVLPPPPPRSGGLVSFSTVDPATGAVINELYSAEPCPQNTYQDTENNATSCKPCPAGLVTQGTATAGLELCVTPPGYELLPGAAQMTPCAIGWFKPYWTADLCQQCGQNIWTEDEGSIAFTDCFVAPGMGVIVREDGGLMAVPCQQGTYGLAVKSYNVRYTRCIACPMYMVTVDSVTGIAPSSGYTDQSACVNRPGWGINADNHASERCPVGSYNQGLNRMPCIDCPSAYTTLTEASTNVTDCVVQPGWAMDVDRMLPKPCDKGTFSIGGTRNNSFGQCTPCPAGFTTPDDESTRPGDCRLCIAGHGGDSCKLCRVGTFTFGGQAAGDDCRPCPVGHTSARGAESNADCVAVWPLSDASYIDLLPLSNDSAWLDVDIGNNTDVACKRRCGSGCIMYRYFYADDATGISSRCQILREINSTSQQWSNRSALAFKAYGSGVVIDYAFYYVPASLIVGELLEDKGSISLPACLDACARLGECLLARVDIQGGTTASIMDSQSGCKLYSAVMDAEWFSEYRVDGAALTAGDVLTAVAGKNDAGSSNSTSSSTDSSNSSSIIGSIGNSTGSKGSADGSNANNILG